MAGRSCFVLQRCGAGTECSSGAKYASMHVYTYMCTCTGIYNMYMYSVTCIYTINTVLALSTCICSGHMHGLHTWWLCWVILSSTTLLYYHFLYIYAWLFTSFFRTRVTHVSRDCPPHNTFCSVVVLFRCYTHAYTSVYACCNYSGSVPHEQQKSR